MPRHLAITQPLRLSMLRRGLNCPMRVSGLPKLPVSLRTSSRVAIYLIAITHLLKFKKGQHKATA